MTTFITLLIIYNPITGLLVFLMMAALAFTALYFHNKMNPPRNP